MDFFQHQDDARKSSRTLILYFVLAVIGIVVSIHLATSAVFWWVDAKGDPDYDFEWWALDRFVAFAGGALLVIAAGSLYKIWRLSGGGRSVAELLGGRPLSPNTTDAKERRVLNVVEEMALASGLPVPTVYLLDNESGINAFAAGLTPQDAVIGVTRGTIELLNRDELQGVIAHEFSHIFNGDSRLNLRLMGVLHGILVVALIGYFILRSTMRASGSSSSRSRKGGGAVLVLPLLGLVLVVVGYVGVFFGRLIKSAVSRQREFLADASGVQYTRNPLGVAGALKKIGGLSEGSVVMSPNAEQASHFFFSDSKLGKVRAALTGVTHFAFLATHPPLKERIRRVEPGWDGLFPEVRAVAPSAPTLPDPRDGAADPRAQPRPPSILFPAQLAALVGTLDEAHLSYAQTLLGEIPDRLREAARNPASARAVVLALLAHQEASLQDRQLPVLNDDAALATETAELSRLLAQGRREWRLPLIDLAMPALKRMSRPQYDSFRGHVQAFIAADQQIDLFELALTHHLNRYLAPAFERVRPPTVQYYALAGVRAECSALLSALAHAGSKDESEAGAAFDAGVTELSGLSASFLSRGEVNLGTVRDALEKLERVAPKLKRLLLRAAIAVVAHDHEVTASEGELLRMVADALGLPMPPLLPGQRLGG